jgi:hypothetical protein
VAKYKDNGIDPVNRFESKSIISNCDQAVPIQSGRVPAMALLSMSSSTRCDSAANSWGNEVEHETLELSKCKAVMA